MADKKKITVGDIDWPLARKIVEEEKPEWYEDFDEAEGDFLGWKKQENDNTVSFDEFKKWWLGRNEKKEEKCICPICHEICYDVVFKNEKGMCLNPDCKAEWTIITHPIARIKERYKRVVIAYPEGAIVHHGDCGIYDAELHICTCGLHHDLLPLPSEDIKELYPEFFNEGDGNAIVHNLFRFFLEKKLFYKEENDEYRQLTEENIILSDEEAERLIEKYFGKFKRKEKNED